VFRVKMEQKQFPLDSEIGREEIQQLTGASRGKVHQVSKNTQYGFPARKRLVNRCVVFDREEVLDWIAKNDLKNMVLRNRQNKKKKIAKVSFNEMAFNFLQTMPIKNDIKQPAGSRALVNKYKPVKRKVVELNDVHETTQLRKIDSFSAIHDFNHRIVL